VFSRRTDWRLAPNRFTEVLEQVRQVGATIVDLTISNPTRAGLIYDEPSILNSLRNTKSLDYDPQPKGLLSAREAVADYYRQCGETVDPEFLVLTTGTSEAYSFVFRLLANPGDEVLAAKPSYPLFDFLADLQDVKLVPFSLIYDHAWQIDFHALEQALSEKTRAIVLVHPNNPTGSYVSAKERERLNELCTEHQLALIVDEVFMDYGHDVSRRQSFVSNDAALTFTLSGISKISAIERLEVIADTYLSVSTPVQWAAQTLIEQGTPVRSQLLERVRTNLTELDRQLVQQKHCSRLAVEGGWYAMLRVPAMGSDEELAVNLLQQCGVLVHPGHFYDFPQDGYLVLSLITQPEEFREGISRLLKFFGS